MSPTTRLLAARMSEAELLQPHFDSTVLFQGACERLAQRFGWKVLNLGYNHVEYEASRYHHLCISGDLAVRQLCDLLDEVVRLRALADDPAHARQVLWLEAQRFLGDPRESVTIQTAPYISGPDGEAP